LERVGTGASVGGAVFGGSGAAVGEATAKDGAVVDVEVKVEVVTTGGALLLAGSFSSHMTPNK
jgi:hypothetical protein